jgi:hypothetical protein
MLGELRAKIPRAQGGARAVGGSAMNNVQQAAACAGRRGIQLAKLRATCCAALNTRRTRLQKSCCRRDHAGDNGSDDATARKANTTCPQSRMLDFALSGVLLVDMTV